MVKLLGWLGASLMVGFAFTQYIPLAIIGLSMLTIEAWHIRQLNLVGTNIASIIGFAMSLIR